MLRLAFGMVLAVVTASNAHAESSEKRLEGTVNRVDRRHIVLIYAYEKGDSTCGIWTSAIAA